MDLQAPRHPANHPDYELDCEEALDLPVQALLDAAVQAGWDTRTAMRTLEEVARNRAIAYSQDPDPEDEPETA